MADKTIPNRASNMEKAEGDRWTSNENQVPSSDAGSMGGMRGKDESGRRDRQMDDRSGRKDQNDDRRHDAPNDTRDNEDMER